MAATVDIKIEAPEPPGEIAQTVERDFVERAKSAGAVNARVLKKNGHWNFVAEFVDVEKAARFAAYLTKSTGKPVDEYIVKSDVH